MADPARATPLPVLTHRFTGDYLVGAYVHERKATRYFHGNGKLVIPVQGPDGTPCEVVDADAPAGGKVVAFEVVRYGLMPLVVGPESDDDNVVYLGGEIEVTEQTGQNGKDKWYGVAGCYNYAFLLPVWTTDGLPFGVNVTDRTDPAAASVLPPEAFVDTAAPRHGKPAAGDTPTILRKLVPRPPQ